MQVKGIFPFESSFNKIKNYIFHQFRGKAVSNVEKSDWNCNNVCLVHFFFFFFFFFFVVVVENMLYVLYA